MTSLGLVFLCLSVPGDARGDATLPSDMGSLFDENALPGDFRRPWFENTFVATQRLFYVCPCDVDEHGHAKAVPIWRPLPIGHWTTENPDGSFALTIWNGTSSIQNPIPSCEE